jgi:undecaprenyl-diphosphatase
MSLLQVIVLGIVQGLAEFLPVSSSAHLIIVSWLLKWKEQSLTFDVALHLGTFLAIGIYFFKDYTGMVYDGLTNPKSEKGKLFWFVIISIIPAFIFGILLDEIVEAVFRDQILLIALALSVFGVIMFLVDKLVKKEKTLSELNIFQTILIGLSQAIALFPGVSRSGATITAGMALGYKRDQSARFSFLMSGPVVFGAGMLHLIKNFSEVKNELVFFIIGFFIAAIVGFLVIHFLLNYLKKRSFLPFVIYRIALALLIVAVFIIRKN